MLQSECHGSQAASDVDLCGRAVAVADGALMSSCQVADCALTSLRVHEGGSLVAIGCRDGTTAVLQLSSSLVDLQPSEKAATLAV